LVSTNAKASSDVPQYDIVVVGAGLVGAAFTCALQLSPLTAGLKIALLDRTPLSTSLAPRSEGYIPNPRVTTITPASESFLKSFGGWSDEIHNRSAPFDTMQVWDAAGLGHVTYSAADAKTDVLGRVIENDVLQSSLHQIIKAMPNVDFLCTSLNSLELGSESGSNEGLALLELSDGTKAKARLVVGSDGNRSRVRQLAGIRTIGWRYNHHAVVSTVRTIDPITTAYQRFLPTGPIALLPSDCGFANVVWSTTPSHAARLAAMDAATFAEAVDDALAAPSNLFHHKPVPGELLPKHSLQALAGEVSHTLGFNFNQEPPQVPPQVIDAPGKRGAFPLQLAQAARYIAPRVVLIGDAAHTVHPLGGQGVNLGFNDCRTLAQVLVETVQTGDNNDTINNIIKLAYAGKLNSFTHLRALLVLHDRALSVLPLNVL
jgi:ubiquinone biosynthesis monooxygenase Coq6